MKREENVEKDEGKKRPAFHPSHSPFYQSSFHLLIYHSSIFHTKRKMIGYLPCFIEEWRLKKEKKMFTENQKRNRNTKQNVGTKTFTNSLTKERKMTFFSIARSKKRIFFFRFSSIKFQILTGFGLQICQFPYQTVFVSACLFFLSTFSSISSISD